MKYKKQLFDLMFREIQTFLKLDFYTINFNFNKEDDDWYSATLDDDDYTHFSAKINISNDVWIMLDDAKNLDAIILLLIHEMCHIFTSKWSSIFLKERDYFKWFIWDHTLVDLHNKMVWAEEQMTNVIDKVLFEQFKQTKSYKDILKVSKLK